MNDVIFSTVHPMYECLHFLERAYRHDSESQGAESYEDLYESLKKKQLFDEPILRKKIHAAMALQKKVVRAIHLSEEDQELYFTDFEGYEGTIARELCNAYVDFRIQDQEEIKMKAQAMIESYGNRPFLMMCCSDDTLMENEAALQEDFDFVHYLQQRSDIQVYDKWKLIQVSHDVPYHLFHLFDLMAPGIQILQEELPRYAGLLEEFALYLTDIVETKRRQGQEITIQAFVKEHDMTTSSGDARVTVIPSLAELNAINVLKRSLLEDEEGLYVVGILMDDSYHWENHLTAREELLQSIKLLSDNSKFEILKQIKKRPMYGSELCRAVKLSKATISHHVNALNSANFISVHEEKKRLYYTLNEHYIRNLIDRLSKELLEK